MDFETVGHNLRIHGEAPYRLAVVHGGPGVAGEMAPLAGRLSPNRGVLEPLQTEKSVEGQIEELHAVLLDHADPPTVVIAFSWGAWLSLMLAARYPDSVARLILVGSGPLRQEYVAELREARQHRSDDFDPVDDESAASLIEFRQDIYDQVWPEAAQLRETGSLLEQVSRVRCPVLAIHGDYDPHPWQGVSQPLSKALPEFQFELLKKCGHKPWIERHARGQFYRLLESELNRRADR